MAVKEHLRSAISKAFVLGGLSKLGRAVRNHDGTMIFYGHRVSDDKEGYMQGLRPSWFEEQIAYITRQYEVIPLSRLVECLSRGEAPPRKSVVLTFDDGFRDNYEQAFPVLQKYGVSASIFVVTGSLTTGDLPWSQRLGYIIQKTECESVMCREPNGENLPLGTPQDKAATYKAIKRALTTMGRENRDDAIKHIAELVHVEAPTDRMMTWDHAREMLAAGIEIGAHTYSHPLLAEMPFEEARWEMERSLLDIREQLGIESPSFCFPGGSYNDELLELVPRLGFSSVFVPNQALRKNAPNTVTPFSLSRRGLPNAPAVYLEAEVEGPFNAIRAAMGRYER